MKTNGKDIGDLLAKMIKEGKTLLESKKARTRKTAISIFKTKLNNKENKLIIGSLERHHIQAHIELQVCSKCHAEQRVVDFLHVWSKSPINSNSSTRMTTEILGRGMYDFHHDLPMTVAETKTLIPVCAECVYIDAEIWAPLP